MTTPFRTFPDLLALATLLAACLSACAPSPSPAAGGPLAADVTYARDVAPILAEHCASCHRPGGSGPFSVFSYEEVRSRAALIADRTARRIMPPWLPAAGYGEFAGARRLADEEIATIRAWAEAGAPPGDSAALRALPSPPPSWPLGEPDLVLESPEFVVPGGGDVYRNFVIPVPLEAPAWVRAVDLRPGNAKVVHHARLMVDSTASSRELDRADPGPGFDGMEQLGEARNPSGHFVGWTPGRVPHAGRDGLAWRLVPASDLVLQLHLRPGALAETVQARVGLYFADRPPSRTAALVMLGTEVIDIPPGAARYQVEDSFRLPVPAEVLSVYPHAHYLATTMEAWARRPGRPAEPLIRIDRWDFDWQDEYRLAEPLSLPAGSVLSMRYTYDNSAANPDNPSSPPVRVTYGSSSTDEMADLIVQVAVSGPTDAATLERELSWKYETAALEWLAWREYTLGAEAAEDGDPETALEHYRASLRHRDDPTVLLAMLEAALAVGDPALAVLVGERAMALTGSTDPLAWAGVASAYLSAGRSDSAREALQTAVELARKQGRGELARELDGRLRRLGGGGA